MTMIQIQSSSRDYKTAFLHLGFRPFFAGAALFAIFSMSLWFSIYELGLYVDLKTLPIVLWHGHEMIYGYSNSPAPFNVITPVQFLTAVRRKPAMTAML